MFKNTQFRIILIFFLVGIIIIGGLGILSIRSLNTITEQINSGNITRNADK